MSKIAVPLAALAICALGLQGCATTGAVSAASATNIQTALGVGCPVLNVIQGSNLTLNANQKAALSTLALACPPNPPPTTAVVAVTDLIEAYAILAPLVKK